jgi:hypothetical protein
LAQLTARGWPEKQSIVAFEPGMPLGPTHPAPPRTRWSVFVLFEPVATAGRADRLDGSS